MTDRVQTGRAVATAPDRDPRYGWMPASAVDPKGCPGGKRRALALGTVKNSAESVAQGLSHQHLSDQDVTETAVVIVAEGVSEERHGQVE